MFRYRILVLWIFFLQAFFCHQVNQYPDSLTVHEGDFLTINCTFNTQTQNQAAIAKFYRMPDGNLMNNSTDGRVTFTSTDKSLIMTIHRAVICDAGKYICNVKFFSGNANNSSGTTLHVIASSTSPSEKLSSSQTIVEVIRICLLLVLIILSFILLCKFW